jgi:hypothetical protein
MQRIGTRQQVSIPSTHATSKERLLVAVGEVMIAFEFSRLFACQAASHLTSLFICVAYYSGSNEARRDDPNATKPDGRETQRLP